jgi:hypothetical protein
VETITVPVEPVSQEALDDESVTFIGNPITFPVEPVSLEDEPVPFPVETITVPVEPVSLEDESVTFTGEPITLVKPVSHTVDLRPLENYFAQVKVQKCLRYYNKWCFEKYHSFNKCNSQMLECWQKGNVYCYKKYSLCK